MISITRRQAVRDIALTALGFGAGFGATAALTGCSSGDTSSDSGADADAGVIDSAQSSQDSAAVSSAGASDDTSDGLVSRSTFAFDTLVNIKGYGITDETFDEIAQACERYDELFSAQREDSDVARINNASGASVEVDAETAQLISDALEICELFDGDFDITIGSVSLLWDFQNGVKPDDDVIAEAITHVDYHGVHVDTSASTVTLDDPDAKIDLGGIAKGWIADRIVDILTSAGVTSALVNLGTSSIYSLGAKLDGTPWKLGLRDPADETGGMLGTIEVADRAVATSGLYDQHFEQDGIDYYHILDPRTGYPVQTDMVALTAVLGSSFEGDGLSTAFFVKGIQGSLDWMAAHPDQDVEAAFIASDDSVGYTPGFGERYAYEPGEDISASVIESSRFDQFSSSLYGD